MKNQGVEGYAELEKGFDAIRKRLGFTGLPSLDEHIREVFFMVCYDLDRFRRYVFESSFLRTFAVPGETAGCIKHDDLALLQYGFQWLAGDFDLRRSMAVRDEVFD